MTEADIRNIAILLRRNAAVLGNLSRAYVLSPAGHEHDLLKEIWPRIESLSSRRNQWDLNDEPVSELRGDLVVACNTFMCSSDPARWLRNISIVAPYLLIQDLCRIRREADRQCSVDSGDVARYSVGSIGITGITDPDLTVFDISASGYEVIDALSYGEGPDGDDGVKFVALMRLRDG